MVHAEKEFAAAAPELRSGRQPAPSGSSSEEQFESFITENYESLLAFATWWGKNHHDADDAVARVFDQVGRNWNAIRDPVAYARKAIPWAIQNLRRDRGDGRFIPVPADKLPEQTQNPNELDRLEGQEFVDGLLDLLPPTQRAVLGRYLDGLSMSEIAAELRKSTSTIRQNHKKARDRLRPYVAEYDRRRPRPSGEQTKREESR